MKSKRFVDQYGDDRCAGGTVIEAILMSKKSIQQIEGAQKEVRRKGLGKK